MEKLEKIRLTGAPDPRDLSICPLPPDAGADEQTEEEKGVTFRERLSRLRAKPFPVKKILNPRNGLIAACVALIAVAGYLNVRFSTPSGDLPEDAPVKVEDNASQNSAAPQDFFAQAVISRERVRDEAIDVLRELTENESADAAARQDAYVQMNRLADEISSEVNIENLVRSKGFEQCVAVVNEKNVNVIVQSKGLTPGEVAQIKEIVYVQTGVLPKDIKIIERDADEVMATAAPSSVPAPASTAASSKAAL